MITIGITGTLGAGKGTIVEYLVSKGFKHYSAREFILKEVTRRGLPPTRDNTNMIGNDLRKQHFPGYIIDELLKEAQGVGDNAVIESIRSIGEVDILRHNGASTYIFAIDADIKLRYERIKARKSSTDFVTFEKFVEDEQKEMDAKEVWNMNIKACMAAADFVFQNNSSIDELHAHIDEVLNTILSTK